MRSFLLPARRALAALVFAALFAAGCSDSPTGNGGNNNNAAAPPITGMYYIQAKIGGAFQTNQEDAGNQLAAVGTHFTGSGGAGADGKGYMMVQRSGFQRVIVSNGVPQIDPAYRSMRIVLIRRYEEKPYDEELDSLILMPMKFGSEDKEIDGVEIQWIDANNTEWRSSWGTTDQTGSGITVTDNTPIIYQIGQQLAGHYKTTGTFNCKLYDNQGNSLEVTDGKFRVMTVWDM